MALFGGAGVFGLLGVDDVLWDEEGTCWVGVVRVRMCLVLVLGLEVKVKETARKLEEA